MENQSLVSQEWAEKVRTAMRAAARDSEQRSRLASEVASVVSTMRTPLSRRLFASVKRSISFVVGIPLAAIRTTIRVFRGLFLYPICLIARAVTGVGALFSLPQRLTLFEDLLVITAQRGIPVLVDLKAFLDRQASGANPALRGTLVTQDPLEQQVRRDLSDLLGPKEKQDRVGRLVQRDLKALRDRTVGLQRAAAGRSKTPKKSRAKPRSRSRARRAKR